MSTIPPSASAAIVGAGTAGLLHALALRAAGVRIDAVYDPSREQASALAGLVGARVLRDLSPLEDSPHGIVSLTSPPKVHVVQACRLARPGRRLIVEKPLGTSAVEFACLESLPGLVPVLQWRTGRGLRALRAGVRHGVFGDRPRVTFRLLWPRGDAYFEGGRRGMFAWGASMLLSVGIHAVDAGLFLLGEERRAGLVDLHGSEEWSIPRLDVATRAQLTATFRSGAELRVFLDTDPRSAGHLEQTRLRIEGGGACAELAGTEADPTSARPSVTGDIGHIIEDACAPLAHLAAPPLLVPFIAEMLAGAPPAPWAQVALAHEIIFRIMANSKAPIALAGGGP